MKIYKLQLTSAISFEGNLAKKGAEIVADEQLARDLLRRGKAVLVDAPPDAKEDDDVDLSGLTKGQLVSMAEQLGIEGYKGMNKVDLLTAIKKTYE